MCYIDVHAHLEHEKFSKDRDQVIKSAKNAKIKYIVTSSILPSDHSKAIKFSKKYDICMASIGLNPIEALKQENVDLFLDFLDKNQNNISAIGEIGIDLHWDSNEEKQIDIFSRILDKSLEYKKPIVLHTRGAHRLVFDIVSKRDISKVIWHCYGGSLSLAKKIVEKDMYISIPTSACVKKRYEKIIKNIPLSNILTETDAPYQSININERNESKNIPKLVEKISILKDKNKEDIKNTIFENFKSIFNLS